LALVTPETPSALLFIACGMVWNGARLFHGRSVLPAALLAGAIVWFIVVKIPAFSHSQYARVVLSSLVTAVYAFLTAFELRRERRREHSARWLSVAVPMLHSAVFLAPIALMLLAPAKATIDGLFALFASETMIYVVGTAFVVVVMAKERVALAHKTAAMTDPLTELFNRRGFLQAADRLIAQRGQHSMPVSVLLFDLDHFKSINDRFGHAIGDDTLKLFASTVAGNLRSTDVVGRLGGEEFAAVLPSGAIEAEVVAERLRSVFQTAGFEISGRETGATVSIGIATALPPVEIESLLARADAALYDAKNNGRNRIELASRKIAATAAPPLVPAIGDTAAALR